MQINNRNEDLMKVFDRTWKANHNNDVKEAREKRPFSSIEDLAARTKLSNQHIETLKKYGVLKDLPESDQLSLFDF